MGARGPARCRTCSAPIAFYRSPFTGKLRTFDPTPIDGHHPLAALGFPVMGRQAFKFADLVELIQVQRQCSTNAAEAEVRDMPWHRLHTHTADDGHPAGDHPEKEHTHP